MVLDGGTRSKFIVELIVGSEVNAPFTRAKPDRVLPKFSPLN